MANHRSADKRNRQNIKKRTQNHAARAEIRTAIKNTISLAQAGDVEKAELEARKATKLLDKAAIHSLHHKKNVARRVSRINSHVNKARAASQ